jgi:hypothetical protein
MNSASSTNLDTARTDFVKFMTAWPSLEKVKIHEEAFSKRRSVVVIDKPLTLFASNRL